MHRLSMTLRLSSGGVAANVLLVFWCQLAHSLGFLRNQPCSDEWIRGITLGHADPSSAGGHVGRAGSGEACPASGATSPVVK